MKLSIASAALLALFMTAADAFVVRQPAAFTRSSAALSAAARPDASSLVEEALKITAAYGIESKEAQVAWEAVEEVDASDNRYVIINMILDWPELK
jgi:hypothetical protein